MVEAYILVQTEVGKAASIARLIAGLGGVTSAQDLVGPFDVIVRATAPTDAELATGIGAIGKIPGVTRTLTCRVPAAAAART